MSPSGRADQVALLRAAIARIERGLPAASVPAGGKAAAGAPPRRPSRRVGSRPVALPLGPQGFALDTLLGGGLRRGALHEVVPAGPRDEAAASGFALALAARFLREGGTLVWIVDDWAAAESGAPYRPGLEAHGLDPDRLILVRSRGAQATLWAAEEALRATDVLMLAELWRGRLYGLLPSRRLVLAARSHGSTALLLHAGLPAGARPLSSSSETRFVVTAHPSRAFAVPGSALPVPGAAAFGLRLDKVRAAGRAFDRQQSLSLLWDAEQRCFHDAGLPVALAAVPADRPAAAQHRAP